MIRCPTCGKGEDQFIDGDCPDCNPVPATLLLGPPRVLVAFVNMQVCAVADATDEEILVVCNRDNPAGTTHGWGMVERDGALEPITCGSFPDRRHFVVTC